jgi:bifunctional non-homologous end joining protein LigD
MRKGNGKEWLLIKKQDAFASTADVRALERSVVSGKTLAEIANQEGPADPPARITTLDLGDAPLAKMPHSIKPMLAMPVDQCFDRPGWLFEIKWDGYRAIAEIENHKVRLYSRRKLPFEATYAAITSSLQHLNHDAVLDGEIVVLDAEGRSQFQLLQNYAKTRQGPLVYYVFDLLYLDGHDLRGLPLRRRKELLAQILPDLPAVKLGDHVEQNGIAFFEAVAQRGLEGVVAKDGASRYHQGRRSPSWLKVKTHLRQEAVICGFTEPRGSRQRFGSLVLGVYDGGELRYVGHVGSGFNAATLAEMHDRLAPLVQSKCPFKQRPKSETPAHWVRPELVCEVSFAGWTEGWHLRHPVFQGLREDKPATSVRRETPEALDQVLDEPPQPIPKPALGKLDQKELRLQVGGHAVRLTNLNKVYWPEEGITKGELVDYYRQVAEFVLPYLKDRPESLHRHPNGIAKPSFFQKDVTKQPPPDWVQTVELCSEDGEKLTRFILCQDEASLLFLANLGCIELNPWHSRIGSLDRADYLLIDLDPEDIAFDHVVEAAQAVHRTLDTIGAESVCKTSGKRGLHIYVPLGARYTHDQGRQFAELIVRFVHQTLPSTTSLQRMPEKRQQRVYLDWLQNGRGKTLAAAYSARPCRGATVSTPLKWTEVRRGLDPSKFTIHTIPERLAKVGDLWRPVLAAGIDLPACLEAMSSLLAKGRRMTL